MKKTILSFGLISGIIISLLMMLSFVLISGENISMASAEYLGYASMILAFSTIFVAVKTYRDKQLNGTISFGKAFIIGLGISLIASVLYIITWEIYIHLVNLGFLDTFQEAYMNSPEMKSKSPNEIAEMKGMMSEYKKSIFMQVVVSFVEIFPVGLIVSLITALALKRR